MTDVRSALDQIGAELTRLRDENAKLRAGNDNRKKLTPREVARIREYYSRGSFSQAAIADMFDVNPATISRTVRGVYHK